MCDFVKNSFINYVRFICIFKIVYTFLKKICSPNISMKQQNYLVAPLGVLRPQLDPIRVYTS